MVPSTPQLITFNFHSSYVVLTASAAVIRRGKKLSPIYLMDHLTLAVYGHHYGQTIIMKSNVRPLLLLLLLGFRREINQIHSHQNVTRSVKVTNNATHCRPL